MWQNTRDFGWAVGTVDVTFGVNPEVTVPVTYPDDTENCLDEEPPPPPGSPDEPGNPTVANPPGPNLPVTGGQVAGIIAVAGALLLAGILAVVVTRRRRTE
jgi:LPXTG-motif cell wall-anchored protein